jgi:hypothetical protein
VRWLALVLLAGCARSAAFEASDPAFRPRAREGDVDVFQTAPPARPYDEVGLIRVKDPATPREAVERAVGKARAVGCDLLVARRLGGAAGTEPLGVRTPGGGRIGVHPGATIGGDEPVGRDAIFVCGVYKSSS